MAVAVTSGPRARAVDPTAPPEKCYETYLTVSPPSTCSTVPVTQRASSEAR